MHGIGFGQGLEGFFRRPIVAVGVGVKGSLKSGFNLWAVDLRTERSRDCEMSNEDNAER